MRSILALILVASCSNCKTFNLNTSVNPTQSLNVNLSDTLKRDTLLKFTARHELGFKFDYLVYLPGGLKRNDIANLLVETTNTGANDTLNYHEKGARYAASKSSVRQFHSKEDENSNRTRFWNVEWGQVVARRILMTLD